MGSTGQLAFELAHRPALSRDDFLVAERYCSDDEGKLSVGLANIEAIVPDIEANKDKMLRVLEVFKNRRVNVAIFPEFSLSGYFWEDTKSNASATWIRPCSSTAGLAGWPKG